MWRFRRYRFPSFSLILFFFVTLSFLSRVDAYAHRVNIFAYVLEDTVYTESYFQDGRKVVNAKIEVFDSTNALLKSGSTDENGEYSFTIPKIDDLLIVLDASMGHRAEFRLKASEMGEEQTADERAAEERAYNFDESKESSPSSGGAREPDLEDIRIVVREEVKRQIQSLAQSIARLEKTRSHSLPEILGGIGYIMGIMGLIIYFKKKRRG